MCLHQGPTLTFKPRIASRQPTRTSPETSQEAAVRWFKHQGYTRNDEALAANGHHEHDNSNVSYVARRTPHCSKFVCVQSVRQSALPTCETSCNTSNVNLGWWTGAHAYHLMKTIASATFKRITHLGTRCCLPNPYAAQLQPTPALDIHLQLT